MTFVIYSYKRKYFTQRVKRTFSQPRIHLPYFHEEAQIVSKEPSPKIHRIEAMKSHGSPELGEALAPFHIRRELPHLAKNPNEYQVASK
jgi:hypothetical protein